MDAKNRTDYLKVLNNKWDDIETYILNIPDEEIRSALLFFVGGDIEDMAGEIETIEDSINNLNDELGYIEDELEDSKDEINSLKWEISELEGIDNDFKETTLDWEMAMDTFWNLRERMSPFDFEKLIVDKYGNI